jgi:selenocysteine-specific elongation factor
VLGTAGHIDHGKTALVRALTGVDTDRLPEEKARGITIELGFAPLDLPDGTRLSMIDVPGHERLVRTMVAGASGIDLVLLVVAADEGAMPQTREHLAICQLLGLEHGVVAITKTDLVDDEIAALAEQEVRALLADGPLARAAVLRVSAATGAGLEALREALATLSASAAARTPRAGPARLAVDRAFSMKGFGTVVTGTLVGGPLSIGQTLALLPSGRRVRVRGIQSHGTAVETALPGARTAVNLQGVELAEVARGDVLGDPDALAASSVFDARVVWLEGAPPLADRTSVELLAGTAERRARVSSIGTAAIAPGTSGFARVHVEGPALPLLPGDRFVLRGFARLPGGGTTIGGGVVLDVAPPHRRRSDPALARDLAALLRRDPEVDVRVRVTRSGLRGLEREALRRETGLPPDALDALLGRLVGEERVHATAAGRLLSPDAITALEERIAGALETFHGVEPLRPGMPRGALAGALPEYLAPDAVDLVLARLSAAGRVRSGAEGVALASHDAGAALSEPERALAARLREEARAAGLEPPTLKEWSERTRCDPERLRPLLAHLEREGALVRATGDLWFDRAAVDALRERLVAHLRTHGDLETRAYKELIGTSRKHAVPLMELFDAERLTLRVANRRVLRAR